MQVRPGANDHGVNVTVGDEVLPAVEGAGDAEFAGGGGRRLRPPVAHGHDLDASDSPQAGDVPEAHVAPGPDQADA